MLIASARALPTRFPAAQAQSRPAPEALTDALSVRCQSVLRCDLKAESSGRARCSCSLANPASRFACRTQDRQPQPDRPGSHRGHQPHVKRSRLLDELHLEASGKSQQPLTMPAFHRIPCRACPIRCELALIGPDCDICRRMKGQALSSRRLPLQAPLPRRRDRQDSPHQRRHRLYRTRRDRHSASLSPTRRGCKAQAVQGPAPICKAACPAILRRDARLDESQ